MGQERACQQIASAVPGRFLAQHTESRRTRALAASAAALVLLPVLVAATSSGPVDGDKLLALAVAAVRGHQ